MYFRALLFCLVILVNGKTSSIAQSSTDPQLQNLIKVSFLSPGLSYEQKIGRLQSLYGRVYLDPSGYVSSSSTFGTSSRLYLDPAFTIQYRYYYNARRRENKGVRTDMNNLNYVAPVYKVTFRAENTPRTIHRVGAVWGLQRNYKSRFSLDLNVGFGYAFARETFKSGQGTYEAVHEFVTVGQLNLGFWLNKRA